MSKVFFNCVNPNLFEVVYYFKDKSIICHFELLPLNLVPNKVYLVLFQFQISMDIKNGFGGRRGGGGFLLLQGFDPLPTQRVFPSSYFETSIFWLTDPKVFLKAPLAPKYINFEGERAPKKRNFLVKIFQKVPKKTFSRKHPPPPLPRKNPRSRSAPKNAIFSKIRPHPSRKF